MSTASRTMLLWAPRLLGLSVAIYIGLFSLDAIGEGPAALFMHAIPALGLLLVVAMAWRWEWIGGAAFILLAILYAVAVPQRLDWIAVISGPLLLVGVLFFWSWRHHDELRGSTRP